MCHKTDIYGNFIISFNKNSRILAQKLNAPELLSPVKFPTDVQKKAWSEVIIICDSAKCECVCWMPSQKSCTNASIRPSLSWAPGSSQGSRNQCNPPRKGTYPKRIFYPRNTIRLIYSSLYIAIFPTSHNSSFSITSPIIILLKTLTAWRVVWKPHETDCSNVEVIVSTDSNTTL